MEAAFFDLDKTVIAKSSLLAFGRPLYRQGLLSRSALLKSAYNQAIYRLRGADEARMERARDSMLSVTRGWEQAEVTGIVRETFEKIVAPIIYAEVLELFEEHLDAGRKIFLVSSSPIEIVSHLASRSCVDDDGRYTGELEFYAYGPHKATAIRHAAERDGIDLARSYAYSDSITDAPMLELVGHPVAVNPDRELARLARQKEWEIREFDQPVRLRRRAPLRRRRSVACWPQSASGWPAIAGPSTDRSPGWCSGTASPSAIGGEAGRARFGAGYGKPTPECLEALRAVARLEGLILDPVYTGKATAGLIGWIREGRFTRCSSGIRGERRRCSPARSQTG